LVPLERLPFAQSEAMEVARLYGVEAFVDKRAFKVAIEKVLP